jgi:hypothetical protein
MSTPLEQPTGPASVQVPMGNAIDQDQRMWAMIAHLSAFAIYFSGIGHLIGPLVVWLAKREGRPFVDDQAKEALNFQISWTIYMLVSFVLVFVFIGIPLLIGLAIFHIVCMIVAGLKANDGIKYRYPLTIRFLN